MIFDTTASLETHNRFDSLSSLSDPESPIPDIIAHCDLYRDRKKWSVKLEFGWEHSGSVVDHGSYRVCHFRFRAFLGSFQGHTQQI